MAVLPRDYKLLIDLARDTDGRRELTEEQWQVLLDLAEGKLKLPHGRPPLSSMDRLHRTGIAHSVLIMHTMCGRGGYEMAVHQVAETRGLSVRAVKDAVAFTKKHHAIVWREWQEQARQMWEQAQRAWATED